MKSELIASLSLEKIILEKKIVELRDEIKFLKLGLCGLCDDISEYDGDLPPAPRCGNCKGTL